MYVTSTLKADDLDTRGYCQSEMLNPPREMRRTVVAAFFLITHLIMSVLQGPVLEHVYRTQSHFHDILDLIEYKIIRTLHPLSCPSVTPETRRMWRAECFRHPQRLA